MISGKKLVLHISCLFSLHFASIQGIEVRTFYNWFFSFFFFGFFTEFDSLLTQEKADLIGNVNLEFLDIVSNVTYVKI